MTNEITDIYTKLLLVFNNEIDNETLNKYATEIILKSNKYYDCDDEEYINEHLNFIDDNNSDCDSD